MKHQELLDKIDGLETDLRLAVGVAYRRGAVEWCRLNYPEYYRRLVCEDALAELAALDGETL